MGGICSCAAPPKPADGSARSKLSSLVTEGEVLQKQVAVALENNPIYELKQRSEPDKAAVETTGAAGSATSVLAASNSSSNQQTTPASSKQQTAAAAANSSSNSSEQQTSAVAVATAASAASAAAALAAAAAAGAAAAAAEAAAAAAAATAGAAAATAGEPAAATGAPAAAAGTQAAAAAGEPAGGATTVVVPNVVPNVHLSDSFGSPGQLEGLLVFELAIPPSTAAADERTLNSSAPTTTTITTTTTNTNKSKNDDSSNSVNNGNSGSSCRSNNNNSHCNDSATAAPCPKPMLGQSTSRSTTRSPSVVEGTTLSAVEELRSPQSTAPRQLNMLDSLRNRDPLRLAALDSGSTRRKKAMEMIKVWEVEEAADTAISGLANPVEAETSTVEWNEEKPAPKEASKSPTSVCVALSSLTSPSKTISKCANSVANAVFGANGVVGANSVADGVFGANRVVGANSVADGVSGVNGVFPPAVIATTSMLAPVSHGAASMASGLASTVASATNSAIPKSMMSDAVTTLWDGVALSHHTAANKVTTPPRTLLRGSKVGDAVKMTQRGEYNDEPLRTSLTSVSELATDADVGKPLRPLSRSTGVDSYEERPSKSFLDILGAKSIFQEPVQLNDWRRKMSNSEVSVSSSSEDAAAITIQRSFRSYSARKQHDRRMAVTVVDGFMKPVHSGTPLGAAVPINSMWRTMLRPRLVSIIERAHEEQGSAEEQPARSPQSGSYYASLSSIRYRHRCPFVPSERILELQRRKAVKERMQHPAGQSSFPGAYWMYTALAAIRWSIAHPAVRRASEAVHLLSSPLVHYATLQMQKLNNSADVRVRASLLVLISIAIILLGALIYKPVTGVTWIEAIFAVYGIMFNAPGSDVSDEPTFLGGIAANIIFLTGILVFAVFLGMIGDEISTQIMALRSGTGPLKLEGHILVLNWNHDFTPVLMQIVAAASRNPNHLYSGRTIVILADREKEELEADVNNGLRNDNVGMEVHTRSGKPYLVSDLELVSASEAAYVIVLYPFTGSCSSDAMDLSKSEAVKGATIAAMSTLVKTQKQQMVVQVPNEVPKEVQQLDVVQDLLMNDDNFSFVVVRISEGKLADRLVAQTALQPGVINVLEKLIRQDSESSIRWLEVTTEMGGGTYTEMRRRFLDLVVIGYWSSRGVIRKDIDNWPVQIHPSGEDEIIVGDMLLTVARDSVVGTMSSNGTRIHVKPDAPGVDSVFTQSSRRAVQRVGRMAWPYKLPTRRVLVIGWPVDGLHELLEGFVGFSPPGTHVTFVVDETPKELPQDLGGLTLEFIETRVTMSVANFVLGGIEDADTIVVGCPTNMDYPDTDALVLSTLIQIQRIVSKMKHQVHVVAKAKKNNTLKVAMDFLGSLACCYVTFELIIPNRMTSAVLTQTLLDPLTLYNVAEIMVLGAGNELYILGLDQLGLHAGDRVEFSEVVEAGHLLDMSVLGYSQHQGLVPVLAPPMDSIIEFQADDKIIVLADLV